MKTYVTGAIVALVMTAPSWTAHAAVVSVDCAKKASIGASLAKLDRSIANTVNVSGTCIENVTISGHRDLTIVAVGTAGIQPADTSLETVSINGSSRVALDGLTIVGGNSGVYCDDRSVCVLRSVTITGGRFGGLSLQKQSTADVQGCSISGSQSAGIGVFGASSVNVSPNAAGTQTTIFGHANADGGGSGIQALDGSFVRVDGASITNNDVGVFVDRGAAVKLLGVQVTDNRFNGVNVRASTLQFAGNASNNGGNGIFVRRLGYLVFAGPSQLTGNGGLSIRCEHVTSITNPTFPTSPDSGLTLEPSKETNCPNTSL